MAMDRQTEPLRRKAAAPDGDAGGRSAPEPEDRASADAAGGRAAEADGGGPDDGNPPDEAGHAAARSGDAQGGTQAEAGAGAESASGAEAGEEPAERQEEDPRVQEWYNRYLRVQADFENYRRRTLREKEELTRYASMKLIGELLPVLDNFERALQALGNPENQARPEDGGRAEGSPPGAGQTEFEAFRKGVDMIYRQLVQVLEADGLKAMEPVGQPFDPNLHQAVMQVSSDEYEEGIVVEVVQKGYWLKDKVLRPALVKVSG